MLYVKTLWFVGGIWTIHQANFIYLRIVSTLLPLVVTGVSGRRLVYSWTRYSYENKVLEFGLQKISAKVFRPIKKMNGEFSLKTIFSF